MKVVWPPVEYGSYQVSWKSTSWLKNY